MKRVKKNLTYAGNNVDCQAPIKHEATNVEESQENAQQNPEAGLRLGNKYSSGGHDAYECEDQIAGDFLSNDFVGNPRGEYPAPDHDEAIDARIFRQKFNLVHRRNPLTWSGEFNKKKIHRSHEDPRCTFAAGQIPSKLEIALILTAGTTEQKFR